MNRTRVLIMLMFVAFSSAGCRTTSPLGYSGEFPDIRFLPASEARQVTVASDNVFPEGTPFTENEWPHIVSLVSRLPVNYGLHVTRINACGEGIHPVHVFVWLDNNVRIELVRTGPKPTSWRVVSIGQICI